MVRAKYCPLLPQQVDAQLVGAVHVRPPRPLYGARASEIVLLTVPVSVFGEIRVPDVPKVCFLERSGVNNAVFVFSVRNPEFYFRAEVLVQISPDAGRVRHRQEFLALGLIHGGARLCLVCACYSAISRY